MSKLYGCGDYVSCETDRSPFPPRYEAQLKAYELLLEDWKQYNQEVKGHGRRIDQFAKSFETARKKHGLKKSFSETDHQFESLANALHNLREQKKQIDRAVAEISLPAGKKRK